MVAHQIQNTVELLPSIVVVHKINDIIKMEKKNGNSDSVKKRLRITMVIC